MVICPTVELQPNASFSLSSQIKRCSRHSLPWCKHENLVICFQGEEPRLLVHLIFVSFLCHVNSSKKLNFTRSHHPCKIPWLRPCVVLCTPLPPYALQQVHSTRTSNVIKLHLCKVGCGWSHVGEACSSLNGSSFHDTSHNFGGRTKSTYFLFGLGGLEEDIWLRLTLCFVWFSGSLCTTVPISHALKHVCLFEWSNRDYLWF